MPDRLDLTDVHTHILGSHILQGVTFNVPLGETTVLLGRNGAGKSTTLRTVMGLWPVQSGEIMLDGQSIANGPPHQVAKQGIGFVPEDREVFASLTVSENLKLARRGNDFEYKALERIYGMFPDLRAAAGRSAGALSGGQQQMLAIGRALVNDNRVILIDEPTKGLAPVIVQRLKEIFGELKASGETILLVEQNLDFARAVGGRFFILDEGRIVCGGAMAELNGNSEVLQRYVGV